MSGDIVYRVRAVSQGWGGAPGLNQFYFLLPDGEDPQSGTSAPECAARVHAAFEAVKDIWPTSWTCQVSGVVDALDTDNGDLVASATGNAPALVTGMNGPKFGPQVAMLCINNLTSDIIDGQRVRGRCFLGPLTQDGDNDGTPTAQMVSRANSFASALVSSESTVAQYAVWSRRRPASLRHPTGLGGSAHLIIGHTVRDTFAYLRSRRQ